MWKFRRISGIHEVPHMGFWNGTVEIVFPVDGSSTTSVHSIAGIPDRFLTEDEARDYLCRAAKDWIDARLEETTRSLLPLRNCFD